MTKNTTFIGLDPDDEILLPDDPRIQLTDGDADDLALDALIDEPAQLDNETGIEEAAVETPASETHDTQTDAAPSERSRRKRRNRSDFDSRIAQLTREGHEARERAAAAEAGWSVTRRALADLRAKYGETDEVDDFEDPDAAIERLKALRVEASKDVDLPRYHALTERIENIRTRAAASRRAAAQPEASSDSEAEPLRIDRSGLPTQAQQWLERNAWIEKPGNRFRGQTVFRIEAELRAKHGEDYERVYNELTERLRDLPEFDEVLGAPADADVGHEVEPDTQTARNPLFPNLPPRRQTVPPGVAARSGAAGSRRDAGEQAPSQQPSLNKHDLASLRLFGLNPNDPKVRSAYIKNRTKR